MEKPITLVVAETKEHLVSVLNESGLPAFVLESIMKDLYQQVQDLSIKQLNYDKQQYENSLKED